MRIIPRAEWGARHDNGFGPRTLPATQVWLHHSVTIAPDLIPPFDDDYAAIRTLEQIGENRFGKGISYTWCVTPAGLIFEGHSVDRVGSHTADRNTISCGLCFVGNYDNQAPTTEQLYAAAWVLQHAKTHKWINAARLNGGHRDLKATSCPGQHAYDQIATINQLAAGGPITEDTMTCNFGTTQDGRLNEALTGIHKTLAILEKELPAVHAKLDAQAAQLEELSAKIDAVTTESLIGEGSITFRPATPGEQS